MNRAKLGSVLFMGVVGVVFLAPRGEQGPNATNIRSADIVTTPNATTPNATTDAKVFANAGLKAVATPEIGTTGSCPEGMLEVEGDYCSEVEQKCTRYIDPEGVFPRRCAEFEKTSKCIGKLSKRHFCIDRYEWPNKAGENPTVMGTWYDAKDACGKIGKRLCGDTEWTLACEGQERLPYPYGYDRNSEACNIDKPHPDVNEKALGSNDPKVRDAEAKRLWQGEPSGSRPSCVSPYGVMDMTGNVDEWVLNEEGKPYKSGLKGGYWGPVRDRCRPMTTVHAEGFSFYQIGFRCCSDVPNTPNSNKPTTTPATNTSSKTINAPSAVIGS